MKIGILIAVLLVVAIAFACNTPKTSTNDQKPAPTKEETPTVTSESVKLFELTKTPCFGMCPVFTFTIYSDGKAAYSGKRWVDKMGLHIKQLTKSDLNAIKKAFADTKLAGYDDMYKNQIMDLPNWKISEFTDGTRKDVVGYQNMPEPVKELIKQMDALADSPDGWKAQEGAVNYTNVIQDEVIVKFQKEVNEDEVIELFKTYKLEKVKKLSPRLPIWLLKYRKGSIEPNEIVAMLQKHDDVVSAELNKKLSPRDVKETK